MRDQYQIAVGIARRRRHVTGLPRQRLHHPLRDLDDIGAAFAQVTVLNGVKLLQQRVGLDFQRPLGVAVFAFDDGARHDGQCGVAEDHQVQIDKCRELRRCPGRNSAAQFFQFAAYRVHGAVEARGFFGQLGRRHIVVRHLQLGVGYQVCMADGDAA